MTKKMVMRKTQPIVLAKTSSKEAATKDLVMTEADERGCRGTGIG